MPSEDYYEDMYGDKESDYKYDDTYEDPNDNSEFPEDNLVGPSDSEDNFNLFSANAEEILSHYGFDTAEKDRIPTWQESMYSNIQDQKYKTKGGVGFNDNLSKVFEDNNIGFGDLGSFDPSQIDSQKEARLAQLGMQGKQAKSLWNQQQDNIDYKFNRKREQALNQATNKFEQYGQKMRAMQTSGLNTGNSLLSQADPMEDMQDRYANTMEDYQQQETQSLQEGRRQFENTKNKLGLQRKQIGLDEEMDTQQAKQQYKEQLFQMLNRLEQIQGS